MTILTIAKKSDEQFLRRKTAPFNFASYTKKEIQELVRAMRKTMREAQGIGLAANQVGLNIAVFVARVDGKFYSIFNPEIIQMSEEKEALEEGCLSVPKKYGLTPRAARVTLKGHNSQGRAIKIKAWGLLARVFQHEVDHLNGILFIDKASALHDIETRADGSNPLA